MKPGFRYAICVLAGLLLGGGAAVRAVRSSSFASGERVGPWRSGGDFGSAEAAAFTRAAIAVHGLLALPAREARYYSTAVDDEGRPLDGRCAYAIAGGNPGGAWFSLTLYGEDGFLVRNGANIFSVGSAAMTPAERERWRLIAAPEPREGRWLPTGGADRFNLTLRVYLPREGLSALPAITRLSCP